MRILIGAVVSLCVSCGSDSAPANSDGPPGGDDGPAADAAPLALDCASYCTAILATCTDTLAQYGTLDECMGSCNTFTVGTLGEMTGNTLGCRVYHTEAAQAAPDVHCGHAGPSGDSECGASICEGFCSIAATICPTEWPAAQCSTRCGNLTSTPPYNIASSGDTVECRLYHATAAAADPGTHCPHTDRQNSATCQ
jgi:hypothetical protein